MKKRYTKIGKLSQLVKTLIQTAQFVGLDENEEPIFNKNIKLPVIELYGTIKLHGTNAAVVQNPDGTLLFQGRNRYVTIEEDNAGFAFFADSKTAAFNEIINKLRHNAGLKDSDTVILYGEWAGKGIQKNVGVAELAKSFYIFDIAVVPETGLDDNYYLDMTTSDELVSSPDNNIYNLWDNSRFPVFNVTMDLAQPKLTQNELVQYTDDVEKECPVAKYFGINNGIGEGIVWRNRARSVLAKIKGDKHAGKGNKVRKTATVDTAKVNSIIEFVEDYVSEERLQQCAAHILDTKGDLEAKQTGDFIRWMINDIISEESDTLANSGLEPKDVNSEIAKTSRIWFLNKTEEL